MKGQGYGTADYAEPEVAVEIVDVAAKIVAGLLLFDKVIEFEFINGIVDSDSESC